MPFLPEMTRLASNDYNRFTTGNSFHTGGVTGSIPVTPTIHFIEIKEKSRSIKFPTRQWLEIDAA